MEVISQYQAEIIVGLILIVLVQMFFILVLNLKVGKIKKRINRFTRGDGTQNIGQLLEQINDEIEVIKGNQAVNQERMSHILKRLEQLKGNVGVVRYNAFGEQGNDLSYSIALLDEQKNGVVITSIYNREQSNTYAKTIEDGNSRYRLSDEEIRAINNAMISIKG